MDIGTNSIRILIVRVNPNHSYSVLTQQKEVVRLGGGEFPTRHMQADAMNRGVLVCSKFVQMARSFGASEIVAVATSASRDAENRDKFLLRLRKEAGLDVRVISGKEEARLIYLGVSSGLSLGNRQAVFIDIGGGSTEIIVGDEHQHHYLDSLKLGAIRLTSTCLKLNDPSPVRRPKYKLLQQEVKNAAAVTIGHVKKYHLDLAIGSSGTIVNLAEIASRQFNGRPLQRDDVLTHTQLKAVVRRLCGLTLAQRRRVPGINPERADIIVAGAAVLDTLMAELGLSEILVSDRGLRNGMLANYLSRSESAGLLEQMSVRERSVLLLGRACGFDETHARHVGELATQLFDSAAKMGLHTMTPTQRELLNYAALLHDIGVFLSFVNHQDHTYYLIRNSELLGFDQTEIQIIAAVARYHRKGFPSAQKEEMQHLDKASQKAVSQLCVFLRLAEALDRSHAAMVQQASFKTNGRQGVRLRVRSAAEATLELWGAMNHAKYFKKVFRRELTVKT